MHVIVHGLVQGVGYRYFAQRQASALGLSGFARNLYDGSVEIEAQGDDPALESFHAALRRGPQFAQVSKAVVTWIEQHVQYTSFNTY